MSPKLRRTVEKIGLLSAARIAALRPLLEHVDGADDAPGWKQYLTSKGSTMQHVRLFVFRLHRVLDGCGTVYWSDLSATKLMTWLNEQRADEVDAGGKIVRRGLGANTFNGYVTALKGFGKWMIREGRASENPMEGLRKLNAKTDKRHERRPFLVEEILWLLATTRNGPVRGGMTGVERAMLYRLAVETGFRANELRSLTRGSLALDGEHPSVAVAAGYSKRRRDDVLPLRADTAEELVEFLGAKLPLAKVFNMPRAYDVAEKILRPDLAHGRQAWLDDAKTAEERERREGTSFLCYVDAAGRFADFHALRHTTGSWLAAAGVHPKTAQAVMRHSDINLTMNLYTHTLAGQESAAVAALPSLDVTPARQQAKATGTDDVAMMNVTTGVSPAQTPADGQDVPLRPVQRGQDARVTGHAGAANATENLAEKSAEISSENVLKSSPKNSPETCGLFGKSSDESRQSFVISQNAKTLENIGISKRSQGFSSLREVGLEPTTYALKVRCSTN